MHQINFDLHLELLKLILIQKKYINFIDLRIRLLMNAETMHFENLLLFCLL